MKFIEPMHGNKLDIMYLLADEIGCCNKHKALLRCNKFGCGCINRIIVMGNYDGFVVQKRLLMKPLIFTCVDFFSVFFVFLYMFL